MRRRSFLGSVLSLGLAPHIVRAQSLMPVVVSRPDPVVLLIPNLSGMILRSDGRGNAEWVDPTSVLPAFQKPPEFEIIRRDVGRFAIYSSQHRNLNV